MVETLRKLFGRKLRKIREEHDLTRDRLAEYVATTGSTIYRLEAGEVWIGSELLERIGNHFRVSPSYFFDNGTPQISPTEAWEIVGRALSERPQPADPARQELIGLLSTLDDSKLNLLRPVLIRLADSSVELGELAHDERKLRKAKAKG